ncbi:Sterol 3-beta-glucosyltransferase UGT80B1 like protein [Verticillium longisporum]|uniref:Sterol 3-beta-glucosyltransferase UGT80B1 like protein n=1 Tax=Verticillium longisporum TaxID=100787 RepID=A0A8I2ZQ03_VERLO|nr:Sterol 3-beta-glucosyltransferase UGT80B1 like protein [Verticillium longisporum]
MPWAPPIADTKGSSPGPQEKNKVQNGSGHDQEDEFLRIEKIVQNGHPHNVFKDEADRIIYPGVFPEAVQSPISTSSPRPNSDTISPNPETASSNIQANPTTAEPSAATAAKVSTQADPSAAPIRPSVDKKWRTDLPRRTGTGAARAFSSRRAPRRAGTSYINKANVNNGQQWNDADGSDSSNSSSSSSSEDEDETPGDAQPHLEHAQARRNQRRREIDQYRRFHVGNDNYKTKGKVKKDGRLRISVKETANTGYLAKALGHAAKKIVDPKDKTEPEEEAVDRLSTAPPSSASTMTEALGRRPNLNIVIMVIGSRGDAQPFLKIGKVLKEYGHRVRIATHPAFREFVEKDSGLEFFSVGGDPSELMAFMVKNPGMIPTLEAVKAGDIGKRRAAMAEMFEGFWRACINATDDEKDIHNLKMMGAKDPFVADAIIANPPSFAHVHCAEALGIPLHLMFTFPYTPTQAFPHPLASIKRSNVDPGYTNFISYPLVEMMVWQGLGDLVNDFRTKTLNLDPVSTLWAPGASYRLHVPFTYLWSPGLVPKPKDWGDEIDVSGFVFLDLASTFTPPSDLEEFLAEGDTPIYIGFGSIVVDDPDRFTQMIFEAVKLAGVRVLLSKGWGGLGGEDVPENAYMLENTPHDWLFPRVQACVIHGGAGTTAMALKCGKPTMVVPFFGDQHFWGSMLGSSGAGPDPVPYKNLTAEKLAEGIKYCLTDEARAKVGEIARDIELEGDGAANAVRSFHHHLNLSGVDSMRCSILPERVAVWKLKNSDVKLSALAADMVVESGQVSWRKLRLIRHMEWNDFEGPGEPVTGMASSIVTSVGNLFGGVGSVPYRIAKTSHKRSENKKKREKLKAMRETRRNRKAAAADEKLQNHATAKVEGPKGTEVTDFETEETTPPNAAQAESPAMATEGDKSERTETEAKVDRKLQEQKPTGITDQNAHPHETNGQTPEEKETPKRPSAQGRDTTNTMSSAETASTMENPVEEYAGDIGSGLEKSGKALAKAPVDLSMAIAQGFHNAPRLYGDDTVRRPTRVTGMRSGLKAAGSEFVYGIWDGTTGVVLLPVRGAKKDGVAGFVKGTGMGVGGLVLKYLSAIAGPVGYTLKGVVKQAGRDKQPDRVIRRARIIQGQREAQKLGADKKELENEVLQGWRIMRELWEALEQVEKHRGGVRGWAGAKKKRGLNAAFQSVDTAERALAAVRHGDDVSTVVGTERELRKDEDKPKQGVDAAAWASSDRRSVDTRKSISSRRSVDDKDGRSEKRVVGKTANGIPEEADDVPAMPQVERAATSV